MVRVFLSQLDDSQGLSTNHIKSNKISNCSWLYLSEWTLLLGAVYSFLRVLGFDTFADTFNASLLHPISTFSAIERTSVLLLGNGLLRNYRFDHDNFTDIGLLTFITFYSLVEAKIAKVPVSQTTRQILIIFEMIYSVGIMHFQSKKKSWPYGYMESAGPVNFLFVMYGLRFFTIFSEYCLFLNHKKQLLFPST